jgi:hypothetical protein
LVSYFTITVLLHSRINMRSGGFHCSIDLLDFIFFIWIFLCFSIKLHVIFRPMLRNIKVSIKILAPDCRRLVIASWLLFSDCLKLTIEIATLKSRLAHFRLNRSAGRTSLKWLIKRHRNIIRLIFFKTRFETCLRLVFLILRVSCRSEIRIR